MMGRERSIVSKKFSCVGVVLLGILLSAEVLATSGYFSHGNGTKNKGKAGAGIALPEEAMAVVNNPAVAIEVAGLTDIGLAVLRPRSNYFSSPSDRNGQFGSFTIGPNEIDAESQYLLTPFFARSWGLQDNSAFAVALYTRSGINTEYRGGTATFDPDGPGPQAIVTLPGTLGDGDVEWKLAQAFFELTYARRIGDQFTLGIAPVLAAQSFKASGLGTLAPLTHTWANSGGTVAPEYLSGNGSDTAYGAGVKLGLHTKWGNGWSLGFMAQSKIYMGAFDDYADLLPSGGDFDIPAELKLGISWRATQRLALSFDIEHILYGGVKVFGNSLDDLFRCPTADRGGTDLSACLGGDNGGGLGWDDVTVFKFGLDWKAGEHWTLRAGYGLGHQPVPISDMNNNLFTPYLADAHYTFGLTWASRAGQELNLAFMYTEEESMNERNRFDVGQYLISEADQMEVEVSYGWKF